MEIRNNVQSPNFGMALKISKGARKALADSSIETVQKLQKAGEELKDTQFFHVKVDNDLGAKIESDENAYFGLFGRTGDEYSATKYGESKTDGRMVTDDRIILIDNKHGTIAGIGRYVPFQETKPFYNAWGALGPYNTVQNVNELANIAKILDKVAAEKHYQSLAEASKKLAEQSKINNAIDNLMDAFGE